MGIRPTLKAVRVTFGERGLKIRAAALAGAVAFGAFLLGRGSLPQSLELWLWALMLGAGIVMFWLVKRTDEEGSLEVGFLHALVPLYLLIPGFIWLMLAGEDGPGPSWGSWSVFGESWSGSGLYLVFLLCVGWYNLLRLNLQRALRRR